MILLVLKGKFNFHAWCLDVSSLDFAATKSELSGADQYCLSPSHTTSSLGKLKVCQFDGSKVSKSAKPQRWHRRNVL